MEDLKKAIERCEAKLIRLKLAAAKQKKADVLKGHFFQQQYDAVLSKSILSLFKRPANDLYSNHEHRAVKIINGDIVSLRLDFLHGQADGLKVVFERENIAMYIWFSPDVKAEKIVFKLVSAGKNINFTGAYRLEEINSDFLLNLIAEKSGQLIWFIFWIEISLKRLFQILIISLYLLLSTQAAGQIYLYETIRSKN